MAAKGLDQGDSAKDEDKDHFFQRINNEFIQLRYPLDISGGQFYKEAIKFEIFEREGVSLKTTSAVATESMGGAIDKVRGLDSTAELIVKWEQKQSELLSQWNKIGAMKITQKEKDELKKANTAQQDTHKEYGKVKFGDDLKSTGKVMWDSAVRIASSVHQQLKNPVPPTERMLGSVLINMPASVQFNEQVDWQSTDLGAIVGGLLKGDTKMKDAIAAGAIANVGKMAGGAAGGIMSKMLGGGALAGGAIGAVVGSNSALQAGIESTFNVKANPYKEQTFQGVGFRPFEFSFTFRARSESELNMVRQIIRVFRAFSKPSFQEAGSAGTFSYPKEFRIHFLQLHNNDYFINEYIPQIKYCILKSINTNFTGQGWKTFEGGGPVDISMQLTFEESEIVTEEDVLNRTQIGRVKDEKGYF